MGAGLAIFLALVAALTSYMLISAIRGSRSPVFMVVAIAVAALSALLAWYSIVESSSVPWSVAYLMVGAGAISAALTGWIRGGNMNTQA